MKSPKVSIIMPVYNSMDYIKQGINCILRQTFSDYELILIDDGSTDSTPAICESLSQKDSRIRLSCEQHKGVGHARNIGMRMSRGEYIIHADADDEMRPEMLEEMVTAIEKEKADLLIADFYIRTQKGDEYCIQKPSVLTREGIANDLYEWKIYGALWNKMIRRGIILKEDNTLAINIDSKLLYREDVIFLWKFLELPVKIAYLPKAFYFYNRINNPQSLVSENMFIKKYGKKSYYEQEIYYYGSHLNCSLLESDYVTQSKKMILTLAYTTLGIGFFRKQEWLSFFKYHESMIINLPNNYQKKIALIALHKNFSIAKCLRGIFQILGIIKRAYTHD